LRDSGYWQDEDAPASSYGDSAQETGR